jgi:hemerythrin-like domain-containing protein
VEWTVKTDPGACARSALHALRAEHDSIRAVLAAMAHFAAGGIEGKALPEPQVFRAMLVYVDLFAERVHHPKEERKLFPLLRRRDPRAAHLLDRLELEHSRGAGAIQKLEQALVLPRPPAHRGRRSASARARLAH